MRSTSETGRAKNIANAQLLHSKLLLLGTDYNPTNPALAPAAILSLTGAARTALGNYNNADAAYKTASNKRKVAFAPISKLLTRSRGAIGSAAISGAAKKEVLADAGALIRRYRGIRAQPIQAPGPDATPPADPESNAISVAHTSYIQKANTFSQIINFYSTLGAGYAPESADLQVTALTALVNTLNDHNTIVGTEISARTYTRDLMRTALDAPDTGLIDVALAAKEAVKEKFGADSYQYRQVSGILFTREDD